MRSRCLLLWWLSLYIEALVLFPNIEREGGQQRSFCKGIASTSYPDYRWSSTAKGTGDDAILGSTVTSVPPSSWSWSRCTDMETLLDASVLRACACPLCTKEETRTLCGLAPAWRPPGVNRHGLHHEHLARYPCLALSASSRACLARPLLRKLPVIRPARLGPREGIELESMKTGRTGPPLEPCRRPQAGKSRDPRSQNVHTFNRQ